MNMYLIFDFYVLLLRFCLTFTEEPNMSEVNQDFIKQVKQIVQNSSQCQK